MAEGGGAPSPQLNAFHVMMSSSKKLPTLKHTAAKKPEEEVIEIEKKKRGRPPIGDALDSLAKALPSTSADIDLTLSDDEEVKEASKKA